VNRSCFQHLLEPWRALAAADLANQNAPRHKANWTCAGSEIARAKRKRALVRFLIVPRPRGVAQNRTAPLESRYRRREPERTLLHATVRARWKTFLTEVEERGEAGARLPWFVVGEYGNRPATTSYRSRSSYGFR
jgi:hypothetical protein